MKNRAGNTWKKFLIILIFAIIITIQVLNQADVPLTVTLLTSASFLAIAFLVFNTQNENNYQTNESFDVFERDRILTIINNLDSGILTTDKNGLVQIYNAASLNLLDTNTAPSGKHIDEVLQLENTTQESISTFDLMKDRTSSIKIDDFYLADDSVEDRIRLELTISPIHGYHHQTSNEDGFIVILRDITKEKSLNEERDEFISVVSHELRTPLTISEGTLSTAKLILSKQENVPEAVNEAVKRAYDQTIFLSRMVNDLSILSRAQRGVMSEAEEINTKDFLHDLYNQYLNEASKKNLQLNLDISNKLDNISTSRLYIQELLQNFITNAIKYTEEGSVTISASQKSGMITFAVSDTGIGISKTDQAKVFQRFYRAEDYRTRETSGTGLGLYVAQKLAQKMKTKIHLKSRLNHGSTFSFELPAVKATK